MTLCYNGRWLDDDDDDDNYHDDNGLKTQILSQNDICKYNVIFACAR